MENSVVQKLRQRLSDRQFQNETAIREAAVLPLLAEVGWDVFDPKSVSREYPLGARKVDYALMTQRGNAAVIIEVKKQGGADKADQQLFEYAFHAGVPLAVLTDGREWAFYLPSGEGSYLERRFYKLDIEERDDTEVVSRLDRYLGLANVEAGRYRLNADSDYRNLRDGKIAIETIPAAMRALVSESNTDLFDLIAEKTEDLCGTRPPAEAIEEFLTVDLRVPDETGLTHQPSVDVGPSTSQVSSVDLVQRSAAKRGKTEYCYFGRVKSEVTAINALVKLLQLIEKDNPGSLERSSPKLSRRTRQLIARTPEEMYDKPEMRHHARELTSDWMVDSNIDNATKLAILKTVCEASGIAFGSDVTINFAASR